MKNQEKKEPIKVNFITAAIMALIIIVIIVGIVYACIVVKNKSTKTENPVESNVDTSQKVLEEDYKLKNFLSCVGYFNCQDDNEWKGSKVSKEEFIEGIKLDTAVSLITWAREENDDKDQNKGEFKKEDVNKAIKEYLDENITDEISSKIALTKYNSSKKSYEYKYAGDETHSVYIVKIENQIYSDGIYKITFLYAYPTEGDLLDYNIDDYDCYKVTAELKLNNDYTYSKYQLVNLSSMESKKVGKIKDFVTVEYKNMVQGYYREENKYYGFEAYDYDSSDETYIDFEMQLLENGSAKIGYSLSGEKDTITKVYDATYSIKENDSSQDLDDGYKVLELKFKSKEAEKDDVISKMDTGITYNPESKNKDEQDFEEHLVFRLNGNNMNLKKVHKNKLQILNAENEIDESEINDNDENNNETNDKDKENKEVELSPSGFSGSSLYKVKYYTNGDVYLIINDGDKDSKKTLIAENSTGIESDGEGEEFKSIVIKGKDVEIKNKKYDWITFEK